MTFIPDFSSIVADLNRVVEFTPSSTAEQNYMYLKCAGFRQGYTDILYQLPIENFYFLLYTYGGKGEVEYMDKRYIVGPGDGILTDCRQFCTHKCASKEEGWDFIWFVMNGTSFDVYYNQFAASHKPVFTVPEGSELAAHLGMLKKAAHSKGTPQSELIISTEIICILTQLVLKTSENNTSKHTMPAYIEGIMERINTGYKDHITLDSLAAEFNVSKFHLSREFKKYTGYSPNEYLISVRINHAKELLRHTGHSVGEISQLTGCGDVNHFIQLFKSREKTTPAAFRRHWQKT